MRFTLFGWHVLMRAYRARRYSAEELAARGAIVCGPDIEQQMVDDLEREDRDLQVLCDLHAKVSEEVVSIIPAFFEATSWSLGEADDRKAAQTRVLEFLREIRDIAWRIGAPAPAGGQDR